MKLIKIKLQNFRNFEEYSVSLGKKVTVFIGRNGMGKTNLIEGMVQLLSFIFSKQRDTEQYAFIRSTDQSVKPFKSTDPRFVNRDYVYPVCLTAEGAIDSNHGVTSLIWSFEQETQKSGLKDSRFRDAYHTFWNHYNANGEKPVFAFFSDGFPHKDTMISKGMKDKLKSGNPLPDCDGYYQWDKEQSCVNIWKRYFVQQWINNRLSYDAEKDEFVKAINECLHCFTLPMGKTNSIESSITELSVDYRNEKATLLVNFEDGTTKPFDALPAGYERIYSIVLDLASRSYLLNRNTNPDGIVFIDEIDLHLHPSLAAEILQRLQRSFHRVQFIVSTHSPMVISNFDQSEGSMGDFCLINLQKNDETYYYKVIDNIYGLDYNSSLVNIMGTRPNEQYKDELIKAYLYWRENDQNRAEKIVKMLRQRYGNDNSILLELGL